MNLIFFFLNQKQTQLRISKLWEHFFYLDFCAFKWYVLGKMLIIVKCWRLGHKAHWNRWENCKQFWSALNQALSGTVPEHNTGDGMKHISLCCSKGSVCHGKLTGLSTVTQSVSFFALCLAQFWPGLTSFSQITTKYLLGDYCGRKALPKR